MTATTESSKFFPSGSRWLRADFHLHTKADKEFSYAGDDDYYFSNYVDALQSAEIEVGVITNHNKFDYEEFKALFKTAKKKGIFLLPGVELSVNDGASGIHTLIVFSDQWLENGQDYIGPLISSMFPGKTPQQYENGNFRSDKNLLQVVSELDKISRDYFLVFAHVEAPKGLGEELKGGRLSDWQEERYEAVRASTLGFQKVRTGDLKANVRQWLGDWYAAEVEGSDCKCIEQIGQGESCYMKIGDFTFEAVNYALLDHDNRVAAVPPQHKHSHIRSVSFDGGVLGGKAIRFSPELNTLIGIRGSGKSSILEAIRYALDIPFGEKASDVEYKKRLVDYVLGSSGKVSIRAADRMGQEYEVRRINNQAPDVYINGVLHPGISIRETVVHKPVYFGQKDLAATGEGFEADLVEKLVGNKVEEIRRRIATQRQKVIQLVEQLKRLSSSEEQKKEIEAKKQDAEFRLKFYKKHGVEEKLQRQVDFEADSRKCAQVLSTVETYLTGLEEFVGQYEDDLRNQRVYTSRENKEFFDELFRIYDKLIASFDRVKNELALSRGVFTELQAKRDAFEKRKESLKEEFAEIERTLAEQLRASGADAIRPDEFRRLRQTVDKAAQMIKALDRQENQRTVLEQELWGELAKLNELWREEYKVIEAELGNVNTNGSALQIKAVFKGDKRAFLSFTKDVFKGSRIRETTLSSLVEEFADFGAVYRDFEKAQEMIGASGGVFEKYFTENLAALLTWQVPNRFVIEYRGKELKRHSLGQRASALILFVLSQHDNDVIIIDQPEDDLDNQTIYEDVIKLVRSLKPTTQFLFATHNANFPVLGDAEQVVACDYSDGEIHVAVGSVDAPLMQEKIVNIMEGGEEAFKRRKRIYEIWKPRNS